MDLSHICTIILIINCITLSIKHIRCYDIDQSWVHLRILEIEAHKLIDIFYIISLVGFAVRHIKNHTIVLVRETETETDIQTDTETERDTDKDRHRERETDRARELNIHVFSNHHNQKVFKYI